MPGRQDTLTRRFWRGVAASAAALTVTGAGRLVGASPFFPELLVLRVFELLPIGTVEKLAHMGTWAKWLLFAAGTAMALAAGGGYGVVAAKLARGSVLPRLVAHVVALSVLFELLVLPALGVDPLGVSLPHRLWLPAPAGVVAGALAYAAVLAIPGVGMLVVRSR